MTQALPTAFLRIDGFDRVHVGDRRVLLSQGETRPGIRHGQHWGRRAYPAPTPPSHADVRLAHKVVR